MERNQLYYRASYNKLQQKMKSCCWSAINQPEMTSVCHVFIFFLKSCQTSSSFPCLWRAKHLLLSLQQVSCNEYFTKPLGSTRDKEEHKTKLLGSTWITSRQWTKPRSFQSKSPNHLAFAARFVYGFVSGLRWFLMCGLYCLQKKHHPT